MKQGIKSNQNLVNMVSPIKSNQDLRVFWKPVNLRDCVWEIHYRTIMKTILQEKETHIYSYAQSHENSRSKRQQWIRNGKNWKRFRRGT